MNPITLTNPNGTDNSGAILGAAAGMPRGGVIYLGEGDWPIRQQLALPQGVKLRGLGGRPHGGSSSTTHLIAASPLQSLISCVEGDDFEVSGMELDCNNQPSTSGLLLYGCCNSTFANFCITNFAGIACQIVASGDRDTAWNLFRRWTLDVGTGDGLYLDGNGAFNACHNRFLDTNIQETPGRNIILGDCDNNAFYATMTGGHGSIGVHITDPVKARSNKFYDLQAGGVTNVLVSNAISGFTGNKTSIYGYDQENGEVAPVTDSGQDVTQYVMWIDSKGVKHG